MCLCPNKTLFIDAEIWIAWFSHVTKYYSDFLNLSVQFSSVQSSCSVVSGPLWLHGQQHARPPCPSSTPRVYSNSCPLRLWCHPTISSSVIPFSSCPQSFPTSRSFQMSQLFASGGQTIGVSASTSVLPMNTHDWSPLGWTGWISLQSKGLSRVFSNTTVQKHQFFGAQLSSDSIFKSRDITLPTKVHLVKAMDFPVVMYGCESWTIKKAECWRIDAFELWHWRKLLRVSWTARISNQSILKEISRGCSLEGLMLKLKLQ